MIDIGHITETFFTATVPIALYFWANRQQARKEGEAKHEENRTKLDEILNERQYYPTHSHVERTGQLTSQGIRYAKDANRD